MKLYDVLNKLNIKISEKLDIDILKVTNDSRKCFENCLYINTNPSYLEEALSNGVKVVVSEKYISNQNIIVIYVKDINEFYYKALSAFYNVNHGFKIGVTGTCGKTTTVYLLYETLKLLHKNVLLISSNGNYIYFNHNETYYETINTTPNIEIIYELIDKHVYDYIIIEVSSQGLMNNRLKGIIFDMGCFLNLSIDHLDYHRTFSNYLNAKIKMFKMIKKGGIGLVNYHSKFKDLFCLENLLIFTFGVNKGDYSISYNQPSLEKITVKIEGNNVSTFLTGEYNAENISCVNAILNVLNINRKYLIDCLKQGFKVPGRYEVVNYLNNLIIVDFAHTEKEVEVLLKFVSSHKKNKLYLVIGCGGDRDKLKRPIIGELSSKYSDFVIFTEDNSRSEKTISIINDMVKNIKNNNFITILNRYDAIKYGISLLDYNDILLVVGKGIDKTRIHDSLLSDKEIIYEVIKNDN